MSHQRPYATIKQASNGSEWRVLVNDSYRYTAASEADAREWVRRQGIDENAVSVSY